MNFYDPLNDLMGRLDDALACSIIGLDGIALHTVAPRIEDEVSSWGQAWAEYANAFRQLKLSAKSLSSGDLNELHLGSENVSTLIRLITPDYLLVVALKPGANIGKARFVMRVESPRLKQVLES